MKKFFLAVCVILSILFFSSYSMADYLTADPQPADEVTKYKVQINGEEFPADIESAGDGLVKIYYDIDYLASGDYVAFAAAGNDNGDWSVWSESLEFTIVKPPSPPATPQNLELITDVVNLEKLSQDGFTISHVSSQRKPGLQAIDGDINTLWVSGMGVVLPHEIQINLGKTYHVGGLFCYPRQDSYTRGLVGDYEIYTSIDANEWVMVASGTMTNTRDEKLIAFDVRQAMYISFVALSGVFDSASIAEINILGY